MTTDTSPDAPHPKPAAEAIKEIELLTDSRVLVYNSQRSLAFWDIPPLHKVLARLGHQKKISVVVNSDGGFADDAFKMAIVIHEFADEVVFLVPFKAKSAATLLCLSGSCIQMGPLSELGPTNPMMLVDERLISPVMPGEHSGKDPRRRQMAAHALRDFLTVAGILKADGSGYDAEVLSVYIQKGILNPFLLGAFERSVKAAGQYAETLLLKYMFKGRKEGVAEAMETVRHLCEGYYDHAYPIGRVEAREKLHLNIEDMQDQLWMQCSDLIVAYEAMMNSQNIATIIETSDSFEVSHWPPPAQQAP